MLPEHFPQGFVQARQEFPDNKLVSTQLSHDVILLQSLHGLTQSTHILVAGSKYLDGDVQSQVGAT